VTRWTIKEDAYLRAKYGKLTFGEIGDELGRSYHAVKDRSGRLGLASPKAGSDAAVVGIVREHWGSMRARQVAEKAGIDERVARAIAAREGLIAKACTGTRKAANYGPMPCPAKPRGYAAEQLAWADANEGHPEARAIRVHQEEWRRWKRTSQQ
jgi:hypothetical protein